MPATIVFTADTYPSTYGVLSSLFYDRALVATAYADPTKVGVEGADHLSLADLAALKQSGWEIGAYTGVPMVSTFTEADGNWKRVEALQKIRDLAHGMNELGFPVTTLAAGSRQWNVKLSHLARGWFKGVRVARDLSSFESYPLADPHYVNKGGAVSWGETTTFAGEKARIDNLIASGGLAIEVIHKVSASGDQMTVPVSVVVSILDYVVEKKQEGSLRVCTMVDALTPP